MTQAAADATSGALRTTSSTTIKPQEKPIEDAKMIDANGLDVTAEQQEQQQPEGEHEVTVGTVTKAATSWLEESADGDLAILYDTLSERRSYSHGVNGSVAVDSENRGACST